MTHAEHLLSFWGSGILVHAPQRLLTWSAPVQILGASFLGATWLVALHLCCHNSLLRERKAVPWERTLGNFSLVSSALTPLPFPFPHPFTVIDHSQESDYTLSPANPPHESLNLGVVLGTPDIVSDPRISCLLSASMKLGRVNIYLKGGISDVSQLLAETSLCLSVRTCVCVCVCRGEFQA